MHLKSTLVSLNQPCINSDQITEQMSETITTKLKDNVDHQSLTWCWFLHHFSWTTAVSPPERVSEFTRRSWMQRQQKLQSGGSAAAVTHLSNQVGGTQPGAGAQVAGSSDRRVEIIMYCTSGLISGCGLLTWVRTDARTACSSQVIQRDVMRCEWVPRGQSAQWNVRVETLQSCCLHTNSCLFSG